MDNDCLLYFVWILSFFIFCFLVWFEWGIYFFIFKDIVRFGLEFSVLDVGLIVCGGILY